MVIDTHTHLNFKVFNNKLNAVLQQANQAGVVKFIVPGASLRSSRKTVKLAGQYQNIWAAVGIHPSYAQKEVDKFGLPEVIKQLNDLIKQPKVVAIGECGLDNFRINELADCELEQKTQELLFKVQLQLAKEYGLPIIIHNRLATNEVLKTLNSDTIKPLNLPFVFHCYEGDQEIWEYVRNKSSGYVGLTANITYNQKLQAMIKRIPLKKIVLETDSPFLLPKIEGQTFSFPNTPASVKIVAEWVAKLKDSALEEVEQTASINSHKLFNLG